MIYTTKEYRRVQFIFFITFQVVEKELYANMYKRYVKVYSKCIQ